MSPVWTVADESPGATERVCVSVRSINSFDAIDDKHLYIKATGNKHYLFTLYGGCTGLRSAQGIAVKDTFISEFSAERTNKGFGTA